MMRITSKTLVLSLVLLYSCRLGDNGPLKSILLEKGQFCTAGPVIKIQSDQIELHEASKKAKVVFDNIMSYSGLHNPIEIYQGEVNNALATEYQGRKIIIYNEQFLKQADVQSDSYWQSIFLLAHEVGHLISDHFLKKDPRSSHKNELYADEFAGFILYKLGADKEKSTWIMRSELLQSSAASLTHPDKLKRDSAIRLGWENAFRQTFNIPNPPPPSFDISDSEELFHCRNFRYDDELGGEGQKSSNSEFYSLSYPSCDIESVINGNENKYPELFNNPLLAVSIIRDTLTGVILKLEDADYSDDHGWLHSTSAVVRIQGFNRHLNPLLSTSAAAVIYIHNIKDPGFSEGSSHVFRKCFKPGQAIRFLITPVSTEGMVPVQKIRFLQFIPPLNADQS